MEHAPYQTVGCASSAYRRTKIDAVDVTRRRVLLAMGAALAGAALPRKSFAMTPEQPVVLLVAAPDFEDPRWRRTVLVAAAIAEDTHAGLILNRPTTYRLAELFPDHKPSQQVSEPVYFGGPAGMRAVSTIVNSNAKPGEDAILLGNDAYWATHVETIDRVIEQNPITSRYYLGHVVWQPGELSDELDRGLWSVRQADASTMLRSDTPGLWRHLIEQLEASGQHEARAVLRA